MFISQLYQVVSPTQASVASKASGWRYAPIASALWWRRPGRREIQFERETFSFDIRSVFEIIENRFFNSRIIATRKAPKACAR